jgi:phage FluMu protein Com
MMSEKISCPRCKSDRIGRPLEDIYKDLGEGYRSYLKHRCPTCGCVFLIRDDSISPGEWATRNVIMARLAAGKTSAAVAKELHMSLERITSMVDRAKE